MTEVAKVEILTNQFPDLKRAVSGAGLANAAKAGGHVIEGNAKVNIGNTFSGKSVGGLAGSIQVVLDKSTETSAEVSVGPTVIYGRIQELGGVITPVAAKMLSWVDDGVRIFAHMVHLPARPYLRPAVDEHRQEISDAVEFQLRKDIEQALK